MSWFWIFVLIFVLLLIMWAGPAWVGLVLTLGIVLAVLVFIWAVSQALI